MSRSDRENPVRTGTLGIALVACLVLVSFGYSSLPFMPQGKVYHGYFADAGGIIPGNDVTVSGIRVGKVASVALSGASAKLTFTVDRNVRVGDQSLAAIRTDTVLGERALAITPGGSGSSTEIPLGRTRSPYTMNNALQDLGGGVEALDKPQLEQALQVLTDSMRDATPQLRGALDGVAAMSRSINRRDEALGQLLAHAKTVTGVLNQRADQVNKLVLDGNQLFAALDERRQALGALIGGIQGVSEQLSGFVADNKQEIGPMLQKLNLVMDNMISRKERIAGAMERLPGYATTLGEVVASGPGFQINLFGLPPPTMSEYLFDAYFQPGKLPDSLADYLRGMIDQRLIVRPKSP
ncbi:MCE family protein [Mycobacterium sp. M1]|uniref:MCE family protein n=1 Tax=Mycolicibacter acidiphilus TaxID=2835306 RepID=A0ABS5RJI6_9MYCO|nr:MCE family protein [Mycolicibacter acidiphilus]MBS9534465.1 MCE family protein [Mycolicibacter acidiphilus]